MKEFVVHHPHNEASALLAIQNAALIAGEGWQEAFWIVSDEQPAHRAVAALARDADGEWDVQVLHHEGTLPSKVEKTEDCETMARAGGWIYIIGSQFGPKNGPLQPSRHFVARFNESMVRSGGKGKLHAHFEVAKRPFLLHRLINDALKESGLELLRPETSALDSYIEASKRAGDEKKKKWRKLVEDDDIPVNIEGSTFLATGRLLLGLRFPVTAAGEPILVEIDGIDRMFGDGSPAATGVWALDRAGSKKAPAGIRELDQRNGQVHAITGNLDSKVEESTLLRSIAHGDVARNEHIWFQPPMSTDFLCRIPCERHRTFGEGANVEGLSVGLDGSVWYVHDDEEIRLSVDR